MALLSLLTLIGAAIAGLMIQQGQTITGSICLALIAVIIGFVLYQWVRLRRLGVLRADAKAVRAFDGPTIPWEALLDIELNHGSLIFSYELNPRFVEEFRAWAKQEVARGNADHHASRRQWHQLVSVVARNPFRQTYQLRGSFLSVDLAPLIRALLRERDHARQQLFDRLHESYAPMPAAAREGSASSP